MILPNMQSYDEIFYSSIEMMTDDQVTRADFTRRDQFSQAWEQVLLHDNPRDRDVNIVVHTLGKQDKLRILAAVMLESVQAWDNEYPENPFWVSFENSHKMMNLADLAQ